jgi:microsomal dipeptidase-like Zn-dependent dipeptidase
VRRLLLTVSLLLIAVLIFFFGFLPGIVGSALNGVRVQPPYHSSARARALAARTIDIDLHADSLLWGRDLSVRSARGQVDVPRLIEGHVALQAFTIFTKSPHGLNFNRNSADAFDDGSALMFVQLAPLATWTNLTARALYETRRFDRTVAASHGRLVPIRSRADLESYLKRRESEPAITAGFLGIEGAHALSGDLRNIDLLYDAGVRMMAPTHLFDNDIGGSSAGERKGGLTEKGREMIRIMEQKHMLVDVAHASEATVDDVLGAATRPVIVSHTGVKGTCDNARNLSDRHLRAIAATGGVVGIAYFEFAVCGTDAAAIARAVRHAADVAGVDHVALGSDFDGAVWTPFDTTGLAVLFDALFAAGFNEEQIAQISGGNALRVLRAALP